MSRILYERENKRVRAIPKDNSTYIQKRFNDTDDLKSDDVLLQKTSGIVLYLQTMADVEKIEQIIFAPLKQKGKVKNVPSYIEDIATATSEHLDEIIQFMMQGKTIFFLEGIYKAYVFDTPMENHRSPDEPDNEKTVRGSHTGFIEDLNSNIHLLRDRIKNEQLKVLYLTLGKQTKKQVAIIYMDHLANELTVKNIEERLSSISIDTIIAPGYLEECIEEQPFSPFPQNLYTERPDRVEGHLMEGRIAVMSENSTDAIILPVTFFSFFQSPDDYNNRFYAGTVFRLFRLFSFLGALMLPPFYIALVGFHFEIIPYEMVTLVKSSITGVPFPPFVEALFMAITVELIREAGIRLPSPIGETIGIVGGLIIGDAVVNAGLVSNVMVIVIALTAIMSFTITSYEMGNTVRILNLPVMIAASFFGFTGIILSLLFILIHMCKLESFGVPYLSPLSPLHVRDLKDAIVRFPIWLLNERPKSLRTKQKRSQGHSREWDHG